MTENLKTVAITDEDQLQAIAADWDRLLHNSKAFSPMITYAWISTYFSLRVRPRRSWVCLCAYRGDQLCGVLPLLISSSKRFGLTFDLADYPHDATTLNGDVIVHDDDEDDVVRELIDQAFALFPAVQMVRIRGVSDFSNVHRALPGRYIYECATTGEGAYLPIPAEFDEFRALFEIMSDSTATEHEDTPLRQTVRDVYNKYQPSLGLKIGEFHLDDLVVHNLKSGFYFEDQNRIFLIEY